MEGKENSYSPTGVLEDYFRTEESEIVSSRASTSEFEKSTESSRWHGFLDLLKIKSKKPLPTLHPLSVMKLSKRLSSSMREYICTALNPIADGDLKPQWKNFTLSELQHVSNHFSKDNLIGKGGYAEVYKRVLRDGCIIAIKRLTCGRSDDRIGSKEKLNCSIQYNVALGTAEGLLYLHESCRRRIIHKDIKAANILLTEHFEPQIEKYMEHTHKATGLWNRLFKLEQKFSRR